MILKLLAGIEMVASPVTFDMVANEAAVTFGATFDIAFDAIVLPTTEIFYRINTVFGNFYLINFC